jgi:hypothetical protein
MGRRERKERVLARLDLRFKYRNYQRAAWPFAAWIEWKCSGLVFIMTLPLLYRQRASLPTLAYSNH